MNADLQQRPAPRSEATDLAEESPDWVLDTKRLAQPRLRDVVDALETAEAGDTVVVIAAISPVPLYDRLEERDWGYETERVSPDEWHVRITVGESDEPSGERPPRSRHR
jgi:uncharacterized protein (DUF2249 family)